MSFSDFWPTTSIQPVRKMMVCAGGSASACLDVSAGNVSAKGFTGCFTDGKYVYLVPNYNGVSHGILTRVDTENYTSGGVTYLDVSTAGNTNAKNFTFGFTDGRYGYLVPTGFPSHGIFTRVDLQNFTTTGVSYLDVSTAGNTNAKGFKSGFVHENFAYLVPSNGVLTRVNLNTFTTAGVTYLDVSTAGNTNANGFNFGFTDGRYAYLVPSGSGAIFTRVDLQNFTTSGVTYLNVTSAGNASAYGFNGGFTDGRYGYLVPFSNTTYHGIFTRVDLRNMTSTGITYLDVSTAGNTNAKGFHGGFTDGRYAYLVPGRSGASTNAHGLLTRVDFQNFTTSGVTYLDITTAGNTSAKGFYGGITDGTYAYLAPLWNEVTSYHGIMTRVLITNAYV